MKQPERPPSGLTRAAPAKKAKRDSRPLEEVERERDEKFAAFLALAMPGKKVETQAKVMPWENVEEEAEKAPAAEGDGDLDDLAWLRAKQGVEGGAANDKPFFAEDAPHETGIGEFFFFLSFFFFLFFTSFFCDRGVCGK